jgi:hypothetical protein
MGEPATDREKWRGLLEMEPRLLQIRIDLRREIAAAREAMGEPPLGLKRATLTRLRREWRKTVAEAINRGLIEG